MASRCPVGKLSKTTHPVRFFCEQADHMTSDLTGSAANEHGYFIMLAFFSRAIASKWFFCRCAHIVSRRWAVVFKAMPNIKNIAKSKRGCLRSDLRAQGNRRALVAHRKRLPRPRFECKLTDFRADPASARSPSSRHPATGGGEIELPKQT